jgi:hypothetical protein
MQDLLPDSVMNYKLADSYVDGTSTFHEDATITVEYKQWLEKIVNKALEKVDALPDEIIDRVVGYLPEKEMTVHLDLALKVTDLYKITHLYNGLCGCTDMHLHGDGNTCYATHANRRHVHSILFKRNRNAIHEKRHIQSYLSSIYLTNLLLTRTRA